MSRDLSDPAGKRQRPVRQTANSAANPVVVREIDENLKRVYATTLNEAVPDRFAQLLAQLRRKEANS